MTEPLLRNPMLPGLGVCDPHVRIYDDKAYLYATHDKSPDCGGFVMEDWWIWSSPDLVNWTHECTIRPEETFYGMSESVYGPYDCHGSFLVEENVAPALRYADKTITYDRHGSFFEWRKQWYFICNDMSQTRNGFFRDSSLCYVYYGSDGGIDPVRLEEAGCCLPKVV